MVYQKILTIVSLGALRKLEKQRQNASGNTKYKVCTYVPKKALFLPEEGIATSSSMQRRIVGKKEPPQYVEQADVWVSC